eukprot:m.13103 g.13103  ORF g.13103 m.13103 type:complete len:62 (+) comp10037_c0_seq2:2684-2869(+)
MFVHICDAFQNPFADNFDCSSGLFYIVGIGILRVYRSVYNTCDQTATSADPTSSRYIWLMS